MNLTRKQKYNRNNGIVLLVFSLLILTLYLLSHFNRTEDLAPKDLGLIKGTISKKLDLRVDGKNNKTIEIYLNEYPKTQFYLGSNIIEYNFWKNYSENFVSNNTIGDTLIIGILDKDMDGLIKDKNSENTFPIFTISDTEQDFATIEDYNFGKQKDHDFAEVALPIIFLALFIGSMFYFKKVHNDKIESK
jgi:hypothetical protein